MRKHPYLQRHEPYTRNHLAAILVAVALLAGVIVLALAAPTSEHVPTSPSTWPTGDGDRVEVTP